MSRPSVTFSHVREKRKDEANENTNNLREDEAKSNKLRKKPMASFFNILQKPKICKKNKTDNTNAPSYF